jgi:hypothetical protein
MRHIRTFNEGADAESPLYWRVQGSEWEKYSPRFPMMSQLPVDTTSGIIDVMMGKSTTTQPITAKEAELYLDLIKNTVSVNGEPEIVLCILSVPEYSNQDVYSVSCDGLYINNEEISALISDGTVELHMVHMETPEQEGLWATVWALFLADDWVMIKVDCEDPEYPIQIYKCDGIKGTRECLEMVRGMIADM